MPEAGPPPPGEHQPEDGVSTEEGRAHRQGESLLCHLGAWMQPCLRQTRPCPAQGDGMMAMSSVLSHPVDTGAGDTDSGVSWTLPRGEEGCSWALSKNWRDGAL